MPELQIIMFVAFHGFTPVRKGDIFIALQGENFDGHNYVQKAMEKGAAAVVISDETLLNINQMDKAVSVIKLVYIASIGRLGAQLSSKVFFSSDRFNRIIRQDDNKGNVGGNNRTDKKYFKNAREFKQPDWAAADNIPDKAGA